MCQIKSGLEGVRQEERVSLSLSLSLSHVYFPRQCEPFGLEGDELWLAASSDRRVSVWAADWPKIKCDLLDWLTFPAPAYSGVTHWGTFLTTLFVSPLYPHLCKDTTLIFVTKA